ncbi:hypothetical protein VTK56DRAFT_7422 [Thermocarpiscus australiensis]
MGLISILFPPLAVGIVAGSGADLLINIVLNIRFPFAGMLHALYILWVYYERREQYRLGNPPAERAPFVYSERVQNGLGIIFSQPARSSWDI